MLLKSILLETCLSELEREMIFHKDKELYMTQSHVFIGTHHTIQLLKLSTLKIIFVKVVKVLDSFSHTLDVKTKITITPETILQEQLI
jgi:GTP cyclohydrolase I